MSAARSQSNVPHSPRALTGVRLTGAAADWWQQAANRYDRTHNPDVGNLLVFRRSPRLPDGHVAVVSRVVSARQIQVAQANWVHHRVTEDQLVMDVSQAGDWSVVQVYWPPSGAMGVTAYPIYGFIRPEEPPSRRSIVRQIPEAIRIAQAGR